MKSCSKTWNHVPKHETMFWNMISCSETWFHVQEHDFMFFSLEHVLKIMNMLLTWFYVLEHDFIESAWAACRGCMEIVHGDSAWRWCMENDTESWWNMTKHDITCTEHGLTGIFKHVQSCFENVSHVQDIAEHGSHVQNMAVIFCHVKNMKHHVKNTSITSWTWK